MESLTDRIPDPWRDAVADVIANDPFLTFAGELATEWSLPDPQVFPREDQVFRALEMTPLAKVREVILGQDPYTRWGWRRVWRFPCPMDATSLGRSRTS